MLFLTACKFRDIVITAKELSYCLAALPSAALAKEGLQSACNSYDWHDLIF
jgi:hypothetical protein